MDRVFLPRMKRYLQDAGACAFGAVASVANFANRQIDYDFVCQRIAHYDKDSDRDSYDETLAKEWTKQEIIEQAVSMGFFINKTQIEEVQSMMDAPKFSWELKAIIKQVLQ